jgi:hypothetical protein
MADNDYSVTPEVATVDSDEDLEFVRQVHKEWCEDRAEKEKYAKNWERWRHYKEGDQWLYKMRPAWKALPAMNYCGSIIRTIVPELTAQNPSINIMSIQPGREEVADLLQDVVRKVFETNRMAVKYPVFIEDMLTYGMGITRQWYDSRHDEIAHTPIDPRFFFPAAGSMEPQRAPRHTIAFNRPLEAARKMARECGVDPDRIREGTWDEVLTHLPVDPQKTYQGQDWHNSSDGMLMPEGEYGGHGGNVGPLVTQLERWEAVDLPEEKWKGEEDERRPWKIVCSVLVNGVVLKKRKRPFRHKLYPFAFYPCYPINAQFWPTSLMSMLESPQDQLNRMIAYECDLIRMSSNPSMAIHEESGISVKDITNRIAGYIRYKGEIPPTWMTPPPFRAEVFQSQENAKRHMEFISGIHPSFRGEHAKGTTSGVQEEVLRNQSAGRIGQLARNFESGLRDCATQDVELIKQFYHNRTVRTGPGKYVTINGLLKDGNPDPKTDVTGDDYEVEIGVGSTLPVDKGVRYKQYVELFDKGVVAAKSLLRKTGESEDEINKLVQEKKEEAAEQAQMMAAAQAGGGGAPVGGGAAPPVPGGGGTGMPSPEELAALEAAVAGANGG